MGLSPVTSQLQIKVVQDGVLRGYNDNNCFWRAIAVQLDLYGRNQDNYPFVKQDLLKHFVTEWDKPNHGLYSNLSKNTSSLILAKLLSENDAAIALFGQLTANALGVTINNYCSYQNTKYLFNQQSSPTSTDNEPICLLYSGRNVNPIVLSSSPITFPIRAESTNPFSNLRYLFTFLTKQFGLSEIPHFIATLKYGYYTNAASLALEKHANAKIQAAFYKFCEIGLTTDIKWLLGDAKRDGTPVNPFPVNIDAQDEYGNTGLMIASKHARVHIVKLLVMRGALLDQVNEQGDSALMVAARVGSWSVLDVLLDQGASKQIKNLQGQTVFDIVLMLDRSLPEWTLDKLYE